jgi:hypothetical protein
MNPSASLSAASWVVILAALLLANLPFLNQRLYFFGKLLKSKKFSLRLVECVFSYALVGLLAYALESSQTKAFAQGWEFYAITLCLFLVLAFPGFVWCYLLRRAPSAS